MTTLDTDPDLAVVRIVRMPDGTYAVHTVLHNGTINLSEEYRTVYAAMAHATVMIQESL